MLYTGRRDDYILKEKYPMLKYYAVYSVFTFRGYLRLTFAVGCGNFFIIPIISL